MKTKVLIFEDDETSGTILKSVLTMLGFHVVLIDDDSLVVDAINKQYFDIVLTDIQTGMDCDAGYRIKDCIKKLFPNKIILAMTGGDVNESSFDHVIPKPIDLKYLTKILKEYEEKLSKCQD